MTEIQSKKNFSQKSKNRSISESYIFDRIQDYKSVFRVYRRDNTPTAIKYVEGLFVCEKGHGNMERMEEEIPDSEYRLYQHFISNSKWDYKDLISRISLDVSEVLNTHKKQTGKPTGYIVDESSHLKKGKKSVGVSKQYAGVAGKVDNCQVAVYSSLVNDTKASIINERLFLPKSWTVSKARCDTANIPEEERKYKTKPELALEMVAEDIKRGVKFDWLGGDGLYGHNTEFCKGLDNLGQFYVLDVHKDELIFTEKPEIYLPEKESGKGRKPSRLKANKKALRLDQYANDLQLKDWETIKIRKTAKGWLKLNIHIACVWVWDGKEKQAREQTLVISKTMRKKTKIKYSLSNGKYEDYTKKEYAYFQAQRYWVERTFDDCKNELAMSDYQIRKWIAWHHHQSLVMLASVFLLKEKIDMQEEYPLMSVRDARILVIVAMFGTQEHYRKRLEQMKIRHLKRKKDIDRYYRFEQLLE